MWRIVVDSAELLAAARSIREAAAAQSETTRSLRLEAELISNRAPAIRELLLAGANRLDSLTVELEHSARDLEVRAEIVNGEPTAGRMAAAVFGHERMVATARPLSRRVGAPTRHLRNLQPVRDDRPVGLRDVLEAVTRR